MGRSKRKSKPKFFPFSAGIQWKIERCKYVIPEIDSITWNDTIKNKQIIVAVFGELLESFISLIALEAIKVVNSGNRLYWKGNSEYSDFVTFQGLATLSDIDITKSDLTKYPVPVFFDLKENVYFNLLNNYLVRTSYWGKYPEFVKKPVIEQIYSNICIPWNNQLPVLRRLGNDFVENLYKNGKLKTNIKLICVILDDNGDNLNWNINNLKELSQLVSIHGAKVIVFTKNTNLFYNTNLLVYQYNLKHILQVITLSHMVLSNNISWEIIAMMISKAKLISGKIEGPLNLISNAEYINAENDIFIFEQWISPIDIFNIYKG